MNSDKFDPSMNVEKEFGEGYYPYMDEEEPVEPVKKTKFDPNMDVEKEFGEAYWPYDETPKSEEFKFKPKKKITVKVRRIK